MKYAESLRIMWTTRLFFTIFRENIKFDLLEFVWERFLGI